jgi:hypothetical protein
MQVDEKGGIAPMNLACAVYRLALSLWVGGIALFTFVVTPVIFRTQGRDAAGKIVGSIFPSRKEFSRLHGISMGVNLLILLEGTVLVVAYEAFRR